MADNFNIETADIINISEEDENNSLIESSTLSQIAEDIIKQSGIDPDQTASYFSSEQANFEPSPPPSIKLSVDNISSSFYKQSLDEHEETEENMKQDSSGGDMITITVDVHDEPKDLAGKIIDNARVVLDLVQECTSSVQECTSHLCEDSITSGLRNQYKLKNDARKKIQQQMNAEFRMRKKLYSDEEQRLEKVNHEMKQMLKSYETTDYFNDAVFAEKEEEKRKITKNLEKMDEEIIAVEEYYNKKKKEVLMIIPEEEKEEDIEKIIEMEVKENKIMLDDQDQKTNFINNQGKMFFALEEQIEEKLKQKNSGKITNKEKLESQVKKHVTKELKKLDKAIIKQPAHKKIDKTLQQQNQSKENNRNKISRLTQRENQRKNTTIKNSLEESNQESEIRLRPNNLSSIEVLEEDLKREPAQVVKKNETRTKKSKKKTFKMHSWRLLRNWFNSKMQKQEKHAIMKKMKKQEKKVKKIITDSMARHGGKLNVVDRRCAWKIIEKNSYYFERLLDISNDETEMLPLAQSILIFLREANCKNLSSFVRENGTRLTTLQEEDIEFERRLHERLFPQPQIEPESEEHYVLDFPEIPSNLSNDEVSLNTSLADDNLSLEEPPEPPLQEFRESILASSKGNKARRHYLSHLIESDNNEVFSREDIEYLERKLDNASEPLIRDYLTLNDIGEVIGRETTDPCAGSSRSSSDRASNSTLQDPLNSKLRKIPGLDEPLISLPQKQSSKNFQIHSSPETNLNQTIANLVSEQKLKILRAHRGSSLAAVEEHKEKNRAKKENIDEVIRQNHEVATMLWRQREFKKNQEQEIFRSQQNMMQEQSIYYKNQERNRNFQLQQERTFYAHQKDHEARIKSRHSNLQVQENARIQNQRKENNVKIRKISSFDSPIETEKKKKANIEFIRSQAIEEMGKFDEAIGEQLKKQEQEHQREMEMKNAQIMRWKNKARAEQALKNFAQIDYHMVTGKELAQYNSSPVSSAAVSRTNSNASSIAAGSRSSIQSTSSMKSYKNVAKSSSRKNKDRIALPS